MQKIFLLIFTYRVFLLWLGMEIVGFALLFNNRAFQRMAFVRGVSEVGAGLRETRNEVAQYFLLDEVNAVLAEQNAALMGQKAQWASQLMSAEYKGSTIWSNYQMIPAKVMYQTISTERNHFIINRGVSAGCAPFMGVINEEGVVGVLESAAKHHASGLSFLHRDLRINVRVRGSEAIGLANWTGGSIQSAQLLDIPKHVNVHVGDTIETSGFGGVFPPGIHVGVVEEVAPEPGSKFLAVSFRPAVNYSGLDYVYVVSYRMREELDSLMGEIEMMQAQ